MLLPLMVRRPAPGPSIVKSSAMVKPSLTIAGVYPIVWPFRLVANRIVSRPALPAGASTNGMFRLAAATASHNETLPSESRFIALVVTVMTVGTVRSSRRSAHSRQWRRRCQAWEPGLSLMVMQVLPRKDGQHWSMVLLCVSDRGPIAFRASFSQDARCHVRLPKRWSAVDGSTRGWRADRAPGWCRAG